MTQKNPDGNVQALATSWRARFCLNKSAGVISRVRLPSLTCSHFIESALTRAAAIVLLFNIASTQRVAICMIALVENGGENIVYVHR